jgi:hypothetical protein
MNLISLEVTLPPKDQELINDKFQELVQQATDWASQARQIVVKDENDEAGMETAAKAWKALVALEKEVEARHKIIKADAKTFCDEADRIKREFLAVITPAKDYARGQKDYAETIDKQRKAKLKQDRMVILMPYNIDLRHYDLENMPEDLFQQTVAGLEALRKQKAQEAEEAAAKAQADAFEKEELAKSAAESEKAAQKANQRVAVLTENQTRAKKRQADLIAKGFRFDGSAFVLGTQKFSTADVLNKPDIDWEKELLAATSTSQDKDLLIQYAKGIVDLPKVQGASTKKFVAEAIAPAVKKISDYIIQKSKEL